MDWPKLLFPLAGFLHKDGFFFAWHDEAQSLSSQHFDGFGIVRQTELLPQRVLLRRRRGLPLREVEEPVTTTPDLQLTSDEHNQNKTCDDHCNECQHNALVRVESSTRASRSLFPHGPSPLASS